LFFKSQYNILIAGPHWKKAEKLAWVIID